MRRLRIRVGSLYRRPEKRLHRVDIVAVYPEYIDHENHDIAMLRVVDTIHFDFSTSSIQLPTVDNLQSSDVVRITGWRFISVEYLKDF